METIFKTLFIAFILCSCNPDVATETVSDKPNHEIAQYVEASSKKGSTAKKKSVYPNSLIGRNTVEIKRMGWFNCAGTVLDSPLDSMNYAVSILAKSQNECRYGKVVLEKLLYRNGGIPVFKVIDEISIESKSPEYSWTTCKEDGAKSEEFYIINYKDQRQEKLTEIYNLWTVDLKAGKFVKVKNSKNVICINPDYSEGL